jgi:hypothetical protein
MKPNHPTTTNLRVLACLIVTLSASVTLSLSKGAPRPALAADFVPQPLLVATRNILVYVDGDKRQSASAARTPATIVSSAHSRTAARW